MMDEEGSDKSMDSDASTPANALALSSCSDPTSGNSTPSGSEGFPSVEMSSHVKKKLKLDNAVTSNFKFDEKCCHQALAKFVIEIQRPPSFVECEIFRSFCASLHPHFKTYSRKTIKAEIMKIYNEEKEKLHHILDKLDSRISLTMDLWTSNENMDHYACLVAHFIDDEWNLQKKFLAFEHIEFPECAEFLYEVVRTQVLNWEIDKKLCAINLVNSSINSAIIRELKNWLCDENLLMSHGCLFHVHCGARILNLIVQDGLNLISKFIEKIRQSIMYVKHWKKKEFKEALVHEQLPARKRVHLDVPTQWNSTFLMLESALELKNAFLYLPNIDCEYVDCPHDNEWEVASQVVECLRIFYNATLNLSRTEYVTANSYFDDLCTMHIKLHEWLHSEHIYIQELARLMLLKFMKYWEDCSMTFAMACIFDPRSKMDYVEYMFEKIYGDDAGNHVQKVHFFLYELYSEYAMKTSPPTCISILTKNEGRCVAEEVECSNVKKELRTGFRKFLSTRSCAVSSQKSELDVYLEETHFPDEIGFDVLLWWKRHGMRFPILSKIARDILVIPAISVTSKSAFDTSSRVIHDKLVPLLPETIRALICTRNWLSCQEIDDDTELDDTSSESC